MTDRPYTNREQDMKFQFIADKIDDKHDETMDRIELLSRTNHDIHLADTARLENIEVKVTTTNGKVKKLEKWQAGIVMAGATALFLGSVIVGLIVYIYQYQLAQQAARITSLKTQVQSLQEK